MTPNTKTINYKQERKNDVEKIKGSSNPRKVVVAGPGTGKSYLFQEVIKERKEKGQRRFLAITFMGRLCDELADDLAGLAKTVTLHGFARGFVKEQCSSEWEYYPRMLDLIKEDLSIQGIDEFKIGDENYKKRTLYYKAVGDDDVVHYAVQICKKDPNKIPKYDLILIDEFQDFNETEAEFIDLLATKNEVLIVGDDDQALYEFKGSFSRFIREKYHESNEFFESHTLKYCSRCTEPIIKAFHNIVEHFKNQGKLSGRIDDKKYVCYLPEKKKDSDLNPKILLIEDIVPGAIPTRIKTELINILDEQKIKSVLVIGEGRTCKTLLTFIGRQLQEFGFKYISYPGYDRKVFSSNNGMITGYQILSKGKNKLLAWRIILREIGQKNQIREFIFANYSDPEKFIDVSDPGFIKTHDKNAKTLGKILWRPKSARDQIGISSIEKLLENTVMNEKERRDIFINQLIEDNKHLTRPLVNLDITVCNILGSKGLGADVIFLIGFDQGRLPMKKDVKDCEIYQMLVALTRAKKRIYLLNTKGKNISQFISCIGEDLIEKI